MEENDHHPTKLQLVLNTHHHGTRTTRRQRDTILLIRRRRSSSWGILLHSTEDGLHHDTRDLIWVGVGGRATVLEVSVAFGGALARNADRRATVGDAVCEGVDGTGLVSAGETQLVALAVDENVCGVSLVSGS